MSANGADQSSSVPGVSLCTSEATPGKKHTSGPCVLSFPAIPADLSLPVSTGTLLPIKLSFKRIFLAAPILVAHGSRVV